jgi:translocator protein
VFDGDVKKSLPFTAAAVAACAGLGSIASREVDSGWYRTLRKPRIQPPPVAFPLVWTTLYADIAVTSAVALDRLRAPADDEERSYAVALGLNLVLNTAWSWVFFRFHRLGPAVLVAGALTASSVDLVRRTTAADGRAGAALAPYAGWCAFATVLSAAVWRVNR